MLVELVTDWLEGELPEPTRGELELHVATCAGCIAYVEQMRATQSALNRLESVEVAEPVDSSTRDELLAIFRARRR
ncbi:MAG TPA: zf-HC2 domain-containing protein [Ilumatobacteraceae bacterium]|nr:zf-HC2 domain-containing protein [Ilumatobacteraceae bacterium]